MNLHIEKRTYFPPQIDSVKLDHEISLVLESPPVGPDETSLLAPYFFNNDPFKSDIV